MENIIVIAYQLIISCHTLYHSDLFKEYRNEDLEEGNDGDEDDEPVVVNILQSLDDPLAARSKRRRSSMRASSSSSQPKKKARRTADTVTGMLLKQHVLLRKRILRI